MLGGFVNGVGGAPVSVAGLAYGTGIDEVAGAFREQQLKVYGSVARVVLGRDAEPVFSIGCEAALQMGVAEEVDAGCRFGEWKPGITHGKDVFVFVDPGAVGAAYVWSIRGNGAFGHLLEPAGMFRGEDAACPAGRTASDGVEVFKTFRSADDLVVIAAHEGAAGGADAVDDLIGIRAVSDDIAEIPYSVAGGRGGQYGIERLKIGMDVGDEQDAHWPRDQ